MTSAHAITSHDDPASPVAILSSPRAGPSSPSPGDTGERGVSSPAARRQQKARLRLVLALGILLGLIGASLLVAFGLWYVKPYVRVRDMEAATCTTEAALPEAEPVMCTCAADRSSACLSKYPCLKVSVTLTSYDGQSTATNVTLYDSIETLNFQQEALQVGTLMVLDMSSSIRRMH
jgi:hypothetical protein